MTRLMRRRRLAWLVVALTAFALLAVACEDNGNGDLDDEVNGTVPETPAAPGDDADDPFPGRPETDPAGEANNDDDDEVADEADLELDPVASGSLEPVGESNTTGLVELSEHEGGTAVDATITGLPEGDLMGRIYIGSCEERGDLAFDLGMIERDEEGEGDDAAPFIVGIDAPVENVADAHVFTIEDEDGEVIACAAFDPVDRADLGDPVEPDADADAENGEGEPADEEPAP